MKIVVARSVRRITSINCKCLFVIAILGLPMSSALAQISDNIIRVGILTDMSGPLSSATGRGSVEAARMAAEEFGGSIDGKRIEIIFADHQNKPDVASARVREWYDNGGVDAIADFANSAVGLASVELARTKNKMALVSGPGATEFTNKACALTSVQWTWDTYSEGTGAVKAVFGANADKWFFVTSDYAFGHALERDASAALRRAGGTVVGAVRIPFGTADFSSFILQAQQSGANVVAFATAGSDTVNAVKQASEFGLVRSGIKVVPLQVMIDEVKAIGMPLGQGAFSVVAFYHDATPETKQWSARFFERVKAMPTQIQAGTYSAVRHYLQAVKDTGTDDAIRVVEKMRETPVNDMFAQNGTLRKDGRMVHDMYLVQVKMPKESKGEWDLLKLIKTIPGNEAFKPLSESECPLVRQ